MRAVVQRVVEAYVRIDDIEVGRIGKGIVVFLGVGREDRPEDARSLADKIVHLRIFPDQNDKMNRSVSEVNGGVLAVSQFTLWGDCRKGRRPSYIDAAPPEQARPLYEAFIDQLHRFSLPVATGEFQAMMQVHLINDGPVTLLLDTEKRF
ncbi:MAG: D-aminoacyl-tRNA deacylase [Desulforhabdus sp.]|nr:D-aminoacyl-tRNA deacylase [Desulforhabdus sp.]